MSFDKSLLRSGDKILFHTKGFSPMSMGIRALTGSFWNHVSQYEEEVDLRGYAIEATGRGVVKTPIEKYLNNKSYILKAVRLREEAFKDTEEYRQGLLTSRERIYAKIGSRYDWGAIAWLGVTYIFRGLFRKIKVNIWQSRKKFFCSELICSISMGISSIVKNLYAGDKYSNADCSTITPRDIGKSKYARWITGSKKL